jgi:hypothetical protein
MKRMLNVNTTKNMDIDDLSQEEFSPVHLLPESSETIVKELNEPKPYRVTAEVFFVETDCCGNCFSDADPGL